MIKSSIHLLDRFFSLSDLLVERIQEFILVQSVPMRQRLLCRRVYRLGYNGGCGRHRWIALAIELTLAYLVQVLAALNLTEI